MKSILSPSHACGVAALSIMIGLSTITAHGAGADIFKFPTQYSAEQLFTSSTTTAGGGHVQKTRVYMDGDKIRMEVNAGGMEVISIVRKDKKECYSLMPAQKMYMTIPLAANQTEMMDAWRDPDLKIESQGKETIKNRACDKYKVTMKLDVYFMWVDASTKLPVRQASADGKIVIDWDNFKVGPQPAELFEVPTDYQKMGV